MEVPDLVSKYRQRIEQQLGTDAQALDRPVETREYKEFKQEMRPLHHSLYEKACNISVKFLKPSVTGEKAVQLQEDLETAHLDITPEAAQSLATVLPVMIMTVGLVFGLLALDSMFFTVFFFMIGLSLMPILARMPAFIANTWRLKSSNQMVQCVFYVVTHMRHTSNLELAIEFAGEHLAPPLSLDMKKVLWDVETGTFENIKESLDSYLEKWRKYNSEFIEAFHLIESSLYEPSEERRLSLLDKSLDVMLQGTYEKMLHYAHNLKSPITTLHMMGVILPVLGLVILPMVVSFINGIRWYHLAMFYNIVLPLLVFYLAKNILSNRPTGYGDTDITELNPELKKYKKVLFKFGGREINISPFAVSLCVFIVLFIVALSPLLIHIIDPTLEYEFKDLKLKMFDYRKPVKPELYPEGTVLGPFGVGAAIISIFFPLSLGLSWGLYYRLRTTNVIQIRENTKKLEDEFSAALFQLGNRLGDGLPAEMAMTKVAEVMRDSVSGQFFELVSTNIRKLGMGLRDAIFNPQSGAIIYFPSAIIESSMKVLVESVKKGPLIAAQALTNVSRYIKEIHAVNERLRDLMADIVQDIKSQINFLTPTISGIVVGITSMITTIIGALGKELGKVTGAEGGGAGRVSAFKDLFGDGIATYYFQLMVGLYVVEIIYILTVMEAGIENGADKLGEEFMLGRNLVKSTMTYCFVTLGVIVLFNIIAGRILVSLV
ncbi:hypothetical protein HY642_01510 [Candidatus Woesearchaeota archaeon]|nr:hypothetical protein [Candidatus Woesearchaeota archaeon]